MVQSNAGGDYGVGSSGAEGGPPFGPLKFGAPDLLRCAAPDTGNLSYEQTEDYLMQLAVAVRGHLEGKVVRSFQRPYPRSILSFSVRCGLYGSSRSIMCGVTPFTLGACVCL